MLPVFDPSIIKDYAADGTDSVDSEDFSEGFGCVPISVNKPLLPPPAVNITMTKEEIESEFHYQEFLKQRYEDN
jgi:hypothetical protein